MSDGVDRLIIATEALTSAFLHGPIAKPQNLLGGDNLTPDRFLPNKDFQKGIASEQAVDEEQHYFGDLFAAGVWNAVPMLPAKDYPRQLNHLRCNTTASGSIFLRVMDENDDLEPNVSNGASNWSDQAIPIPGLIAVGFLPSNVVVYERYFSNGSIQIPPRSVIVARCTTAVGIQGIFGVGRIQE